jgi:hypothetical protein
LFIRQTGFVQFSSEVGVLQVGGSAAARNLAHQPKGGLFKILKTFFVINELFHKKKLELLRKQKILTEMQ